jgi:hypothetical protein
LEKKLEQKFAEMVRKDEERKSIMIDKLLMGIASPFTKRVSSFNLPEKFKPPQMLSFVGTGDPVEHLKNFQTHMDLHDTLDEVACRALPLTLSGSARDWF